MVSLTRPEGSEPEDFHVTRRAAAGLFFAGFALAAYSAEAAPIITSDEGLITEQVMIPNNVDKPIPAYVARPKGKGRHPAIIVASEVFGVHEYIRDVCRRLAKAGYVAIAPDFFFRSGVNLAAMKEIPQIMPFVRQASERQVDGDVRMTTLWLKDAKFVKADRIGITGFCWGGAVVWRSAMVNSDIRAGVAWYGQVRPLIGRTRELQAPVLGLYAEKDQGIPLADVNTFQAALGAMGKTGSSIHVYKDAPHGFHADYRDSYREADAKDGWKRMLAHFKANGVA